MTLYPAIFDTDSLSNDLDKPCPAGKDFQIYYTCEKLISDVCLYSNDNDLEDEAECIYQNDFEFTFEVYYEGPYIELDKIKYGLYKDGKLKTKFDSSGTPSSTLADGKWEILETENNNDWDLPGKVTYSNDTEFYSSFLASRTVEDCGEWELKLYAERSK